MIQFSGITVEPIFTPDLFSAIISRQAFKLNILTVSKAGIRKVFRHGMGHVDAIGVADHIEDAGPVNDVQAGLWVDQLIEFDGIFFCEGIDGLVDGGFQRCLGTWEFGVLAGEEEAE